MRASAYVALVASALAFIGPVTAADERDVIGKVMEFAGEARQSLEQGEAVRTEIHVSVLVNGRLENEAQQLSWSRGAGHLRIERPMENEVRILTPIEAWINQGTANVALHVPPATMESFGDDREKRLSEIGFGPALAIFRAIEADKDKLSLKGSREYAGLDCWELSLDTSGEVSPIWGDVVNLGVPAEIRYTNITLAFDKEKAYPRGLEFGMRTTLPNGIEADVEIRAVITAIEAGPDIDVPDALFEFAPPDECTIIEYPVDGNGADVMAAFGRAVREHARGGGQAGE